MRVKYARDQIVRGFLEEDGYVNPSVHGYERATTLPQVPYLCATLDTVTRITVVAMLPGCADRR